MPNVTFIASRRKGPLRNFVPTAHLRCIAVCRIQTGHRRPDDGVGCSVLFTEQTPRPSRHFYESGNLRISLAQLLKTLAMPSSLVPAQFGSSSGILVPHLHWRSFAHSLPRRGQGVAMTRLPAKTGPSTIMLRDLSIRRQESGPRRPMMVAARPRTLQIGWQKCARHAIGSASQAARRVQ